MSTPTHLAHKPITSVNDYRHHDGIYKDNTDAESLSVGIAQYNKNEISAKVFRYSGSKWSRLSEELPLHRVFDLNTTILKSILLSAGVASPATELHVHVESHEKLKLIVDFYKKNQIYIRPKLQELQMVLNYIMQEESQL